MKINYPSSLHKNSLFSTGAVFLLLLFTSCVGIRPQATKSGKSLFETFYVGEEGAQYFIKPVSFEGDNNEMLTADFTFRYNKDFSDSTTVNLSLFTLDATKDIDSIVIVSGDYEASIFNFEHLFSERTTKNVHARFTSKMESEHLKPVFSSDEWLIKVYSAPALYEFQTTKKTSKNIDELYFQIFSLL